MATKKTTKNGKLTVEPAKAKSPRQMEVVGARPKRDPEIDDEADVLKSNRTKRLKYGKLEEESEGRIIALAIGKGLIVEGEALDYVLPSGQHLVIGPKSTKMGAKIVDPKEDGDAEPPKRKKAEQTKMDVEASR